MTKRLWFLTVGLIIACLNPASAQSPIAANLEPIGNFKIQGALTDDDDAVARDVSGIACMPEIASRRVCLIINDQDRTAQFATIESGRLVAGAKVRLIGKEPSPSTLGNEPQEVAC